MNIYEVRLANFRNYDGLLLKCHPKLNIFVGQNGEGKTNLLEAIYYLAVGTSFRGQHEVEMLMWDKIWLRLAVFFGVEDSERVLRQDLYYDPAQKKKLALNGVKYRKFEEMPERLNVVLFTPDDLDIIKGSPDRRRRFIDLELQSLYPSYAAIRRGYRKALNQRNELLKDIRARRAEKSFLSIWNEQLANYGAKMIYERVLLLRHLVPQARKIHAYMTKEAGRFDVRYQSSLGTDIIGMDIEALNKRFLEKLMISEQDDIRNGTTGIGPHRDDLAIYEEGIDLRIYGSQGQQRTAVLVLKLAEIDVFMRIYGRTPILLLDDVMSELDEERRNLLLKAVLKKNLQTFLTTTSIDFKIQNSSNACIFRVNDGKMTRVIK